MTKFILIIACVCILGTFAGALSASTPKHAAVETLSPLAMMMEMDLRSLPVESCDAV
ncbi:hypothetical protein JQ596_10100 [Bradyrhizobium manausense]|uniref:hypothetical protein n=1 Tax=Bradyrhizobium TaxID=374 RepID=UPI001BACA8B8|nr:MULTISPECIES: hypothetical protein [Bradyrhizobium]MBR0825889.1 hypothetical protein [Bradyrhizobium manausense]UVO31174.1 hypothetical protein KUF59_11250 [Bradyrhizobium arachidis]